MTTPTAAGQPTTVYRTPACFLCGRHDSIELPSAITDAIRAGTPVQEVLPAMPRPEREQLISGTHPACWTTVFGDPDH